MDDVVSGEADNNRRGGGGEEVVEEEEDDDDTTVTEEGTTESSPSSSKPKKRRKKRVIKTFHTVTVSRFIPNTSTEEANGNGTTSESTASVITSTVPTSFYRKNGQQVVYYEDTQMVESMHQAATLLLDTLQTTMEQHEKAKTASGPSFLLKNAKSNDDVTSLSTETNNNTTAGTSSVIVPKVLIEKEESEETRKLFHGQQRLTQSLQIPTRLEQQLDTAITNALKESQMIINLRAFLIMRNNTNSTGKRGGANSSGLSYQEYKSAVHYENMRNDAFAPRIITLDELSADIFQLPTATRDWLIKETLHICLYLEDPRHCFHYQIYKREIEYISDEPVDDKTSALAKFFMPSKMGHYYAIIVNFGRSQRPVPVVIKCPRRKPFISNNTSMIQSSIII